MARSFKFPKYFLIDIHAASAKPALESKIMCSYFVNGRVLLLAMLALVISGCGANDGTYPVKGVVEFADGSRLTAGVIIFDNGITSAMGEIQTDGSFELSEGAEPGTHTIFFAGEATGGDYGKPLVAAKYIDPTKSDLRVEVKAEPNELAPIVVEKAR